MDDQRTQLALRAANLYYLQDVKMEAISREMGFSRSTVSRLLKDARESGLVEITLRQPHERSHHFEKTLSSRLGVHVSVVPVSDRTSDAEKLARVANVTARILHQLMESDTVLAVAWGTSIAAVSRNLIPKSTRGSRIVQLNGAANTQTTGIEYASEIISRFGQAFEASVHQFPVPAFFDYPETKAAMWRERSIRRILGLQRRASIALFSVGAVSAGLPSHVYSAGYLDSSDREAMEREQVACDVCTVFLREDGSYADIELNARTSGPSPDQLRQIPKRICLVTGDQKIPGIRAAIAAHLLTDLIIDEATAADLLETL